MIKEDLALAKKKLLEKGIIRVSDQVRWSDDAPRDLPRRDETIGFMNVRGAWLEIAVLTGEKIQETFTMRELADRLMNPNYPFLSVVTEAIEARGQKLVNKVATIRQSAAGAAINSGRARQDQGNDQADRDALFRYVLEHRGNYSCAMLGDVLRKLVDCGDSTPVAIDGRARRAMKLMADLGLGDCAGMEWVWNASGKKVRRKVLKPFYDKLRLYLVNKEPLTTAHLTSFVGVAVA